MINLLDFLKFFEIEFNNMSKESERENNQLKFVSGNFLNYNKVR